MNTEERIITDRERIERFFSTAGDGHALFITLKAFGEPAPPKDWRPKCFCPLDWDNHVVCENYSLKTHCGQCSFREIEYIRN